MSGDPRPAPEGYQSDYAALLDIVRFGWGVWPWTQVAALQFHAERAIGKVSDCHSQHQATRGIPTKDGERWVRGPSGLSKGAWVAANAALVKAGIIQRTPSKGRNGGNGASEYLINWPAVAAAIEEWKRSSRPSARPATNQNTNDRGHTVTKGGGHAVTKGGGHAVTKGVGHAVTKGWSHGDQGGWSRGDQGAWTALGHAVTTQSSQSQSLDFKVSHSPAARDTIRWAIEDGGGEKVRQDGLITAILDEGHRQNLCLEVLVRFIVWFRGDKRARGKQANPALIAKAVCEGDIRSWAQELENQNFIVGAQRRAALERQRESGVEPLAQQTPAKDLIAEIKAGLKAKGKSA